MSLILILCIILSLVTQAESFCSCTNSQCAQCPRTGRCSNLYDCICQCIQGRCSHGCENPEAACHSSSNCRSADGESLANSTSTGLNEGSEEVGVEDHSTFDDVPDKFSHSVPDEVTLINAERISDSETEFESSWGVIHINGMHSSNEKHYSGVQVKLDGTTIGEKVLQYQKSKCFKVQRTAIHGKICVTSEREGIFLTVKLVTKEGIITTSKPLNLLPNGIEGIASQNEFNSINANPTSANKPDLESLNAFVLSMLSTSIDFQKCQFSVRGTMGGSAISTYVRKMEVSSNVVTATSLTPGSLASVSINIAGTTTAYRSVRAYWFENDQPDFTQQQSYTLNAQLSFQCNPMYATNFVATSVTGASGNFQGGNCDLNNIIKTTLNSNFVGKSLDAATGVC